MKILLEDTYEPGVVVCVVIPGGWGKEDHKF
jgi:hypothetical protein